jgi:hypothetical protein
MPKPFLNASWISLESSTPEHPTIIKLHQVMLFGRSPTKSAKHWGYAQFQGRSEQNLSKNGIYAHFSAG